ncbi:CIA30 family protein [Massilia glaciei]|uniref:Amidohydrolase n=1 Tax=Massilia glaciei TaxID=1524097 RepID=A0A2U2HJI9_9BURK|nr:CIA30 family protein [Massilia glaciei]PWF47576.1 amidohydrolase [Massilia glaciei]
MKQAFVKPLVKTLFLAGVFGVSMAASAAPTLVQDVRVFDGERMHAKRSVLFDGAVIVNADHRGAAPRGATVVSGAGRTLLPGLIDAHVHAYRHPELPLLFGVTTQVDMFTAVQVMQDATRKMKAGGNREQADLFSAGTLATAPGGHGTQFGMPIPTLSAPGQAQAFVDARIAEGSHFIKIVMESGRPGHATPSLDEATVKALVAAAHARGKLAVVHISTAADARKALAMGADGLVHLFVGEAMPAAELASLVALAKEWRAFVIPTFSVLESVAGVGAADILGDAGLGALMDKEQTATLKSNYAGGASRPGLLAAPNALVAALAKAGVPVLAGTDAGNPGTQHGISMHHEMASLVKAGLTPVQALAAASAAPAAAFRLGQRGRIANGYKADLLLVEGDPGSDIAATRRIVAVWKDGADAAPLREKQRALVARERAAKPPGMLALPADGRISLFSKDKLAGPFGVWMPSDDGFMGGKSKVKVQAGAPDANAQAPLAVSASVAAGFPYPWAGVAFMPGAQPMQPANLSAARLVRFKVRGDGQTYAVSMMSQGGAIPVSKGFTAGPEWTEVAMPFADFKGIDTSAITMIAFNAGPKPGEYKFELADVRLLNE